MPTTATDECAANHTCKACRREEQVNSIALQRKFHKRNNQEHKQRSPHHVSLSSPVVLERSTQTAGGTFAWTLPISRVRNAPNGRVDQVSRKGEAGCRDSRPRSASEVTALRSPGVNEMSKPEAERTLELESSTESHHDPNAGALAAASYIAP